MLCVLTLALAGCGGYQKTNTDTIKIFAAQAFKNYDNYELFLVESDGRIADTTTITLSAALGPSDIAAKLAEKMLKGQTQKTAIAVNGRSKSLTAQIIKDACDINKGKSIEFLTLLYLGEASYEPSIRQKVEALNATFLFEQVK